MDINSLDLNELVASKDEGMQFKDLDDAGDEEVSEFDASEQNTSKNLSQS